MTFQPLRLKLLLITAIRIVLAPALLAVAWIGNAPGRSLVGAFGVGAMFLAFAALNDRRALLLRRQREPGPLPGDAVQDPPWRIAVDAMYPSTFAVSALSLVAVAIGEPVLAAGLAGAVAGMGIASAVSLYPVRRWEREQGGRLYATRGGHGYYVG